jgi:hypothetical protein
MYQMPLAAQQDSATLHFGAYILVVQQGHQIVLSTSPMHLDVGVKSVQRQCMPHYCSNLHCSTNALPDLGI